MRKIHYILLFLFPLYLSGQVDYHAWNTLKVSHKIDQQWSVSAAWIYRNTLDEFEHLNHSLDLGIQYNWKNYFARFITRTWYIADQNLRQFIWFDIGMKQSALGIPITHRLRYHGITQNSAGTTGDLLRLENATSFSISEKWSVPFSVELWYQIQQDDRSSGWDRVRTQLGIAYSLSSKLQASLLYRHEQFTNRDPFRLIHMSVLTLHYKL